MPKYTITLSTTTDARLNVVLAQFNAAAGLSLNKVEWFEYQLKELAVRDEYQALLKPIVEKAEKDARKTLERRLTVVRQRLLRDLEPGRPSEPGGGPE